MDTLQYFVEKYQLDISKPSPIEIPNVGRDNMGHWFRELGFMQGVELGVEAGIFSRILLDANPTMQLSCVDVWEYYSGYTTRVSKRDLSKRYFDAQKRLKGFNVKFIKEYSSKAVKRFADNSLDFVYIDANHNLPWVMDDIIWWEKKVRPGGIVSGHDYIKSYPNNPTQLRVVEAVNWYAELKPIKTWFLLGTRAKIEGQIRDDHRTWMWVK